MVAGSDLPASVGFGRFRVLPHRRELLVDGQPAKLGGRAFDILLALIEARGAVVSKNALMARVWPGRVVEENNLQSHISALRAALGRDREVIRTVSGRGYQFVGEILALPEGGDDRASLGPKAADPGALPPTNVPEPVSELIGREDELAEVVNLMGAHRLVTLTGAGGIGKTRLAVALARELRPHFADGVAAAVGLELGGEASVQNVAQRLAGRRLLLVLDTCEHVIEIAASMAEAALGAGPELRILATSRELLKAEGEWVYPVSPLAVPTAEVEQGDFVEYGAIRLFLERARAANPRFAPDRPLVELIAAICRRLDGIPLAIELAAARASALGVEGIAARLDDRFHLLTGGKRTALPRHQTLRATLDWSYELLTEPERVILRRLAVFAGPFSLEAATAVAADPETELASVVENLASLVMKSLVTTEGDGAVARYRLLDTTRAYATEKLDESGQRDSLGGRHAEYYRDVFERAETEVLARPASEWLADYAPEIDNLRSALDWAFSPHGGDVSVGIALTAAAVPLWVYLSLVDECRRRVERALTALVAAARSDACLEMKLQAALGESLRQVGGAVTEMESAWTRTLELAKGTGNVDYELRALVGLWMFRDQGSLALARQFAAGAKTPADRLIGDQMIGHSYFIQGNQSSARRHLERAIANHVPGAFAGSAIIRFQLDHDPMRSLARVLWLQGLPEQAMCMAERLVERAKAQDHAYSLCSSLALAACPIALWTGNFHLAEQYIEVLHETSNRYALISGMLSAAPIGACFSPSGEICGPNCLSCVLLSRSAGSCPRAIGY